MKNKLVEFIGRKGWVDYVIKPINTFVVTEPDEFKEVLIIHPEGFIPNNGEIQKYDLDKEKTYVWVQVSEIKILENG